MGESDYYLIEHDGKSYQVEKVSKTTLLDRLNHGHYSQHVLVPDFETKVAAGTTSLLIVKGEAVLPKAEVVATRYSVK
jgi:hypothetical protein